MDQQSPIDQPHLVKRVLYEAVYYPPHPPRTESSAYKAMHHQVVVVEDHPCIVCGVRNSTLNDPKHNRIGAKAIETHHHQIEWALINAIDLAKFNQRIVRHFRRIRPGEAKYAQDFTQEQMEDWIDHDPDNIWVICDKHHRDRQVGIHDISGPIWGAQDLLADDYQYTPNEAVAVTVPPGSTVTVQVPAASDGEQS